MPFPKNCPDLEQLAHMPPQEIAALPADVLAVLQHKSETALKCAKAIKTQLDGALALKYGEQVTCSLPIPRSLREPLGLIAGHLRRR